LRTQQLQRKGVMTAPEWSPLSRGEGFRREWDDVFWKSRPVRIGLQDNAVRACQPGTAGCRREILYGKKNVEAEGCSYSYSP